ncbi:MAG: DUF4097 family beta strand repeat-containing protein [Balneolaceae bacterium]|nr:DUF4097 family beta strand repeat-containing protein [Balneolaceae bacterium]
MAPRIRLLFTLLIALVTFPAVAQDSREFNMDETFAVDAGGSIVLDSNDAEVEIRGADRSDVHVVVHYRRTSRGVQIGGDRDFEMVAEERGGDLVLRERIRGESDFNISLGSVEETYRITIEAPRWVNLDLNGDDDNYSIRGINGDIAINAEDGDLWLQDCGGSSFRFTLDDGDLEMDGGRGELILRFEDGDVDIRNGAFTDIRTDADDGDLRLETSLADDGSYRFDSEDGDLHLYVTEGGGEFVVDHDDPSVRASSAYEKLQEEEYRSRWRLSGGSARVDLRTDDGRVYLDVW